MKQNEKSNGSLRERWAERWAERLAGPASAEEMGMWPLMLRTLALNLRAGIPLQEAVHANPGSGQFAQFGQNEPVPDAGKTRRKQPSGKMPGKVPRLDGYEVSLLKTTSISAVPKISAVSRRRLPRSPPGVPPHTLPARSYLKVTLGCVRTAANACMTCN